ncbi:MAG: DUF4292 domain-containing protein [Cyclobacteriaceae bacterium]|nr:DUF4292 domain-containing protein [Cyclobacteriaceae bacterium]
MKINRIFFMAMALLIMMGCSKKTVGIVEFDGGTLDINEVDFNYFQGKMKINYKDKDSDIKVKASIRMRKDSVIWMTFSGTGGITGGKCLINKDSITIVNSLKNEYFVFEYPELTQRFRFNVDYATIQAATIGNLIIQRQQSDKASKAEELMVLKQKSGSVSISNYINQDTHKIVRVDMMENPSKNTASIHYENFQMVEDQFFPFTGIISLFYKTQNLTYNTTIEFEYNKAEILDKPIRFPIKIPKKYAQR